MDTDDPAVVMEVGFTIQGRSRQTCIELADSFGGLVLQNIGGEPWVMLDDDWTRMRPDERLAISDDQGFMYSGRRRYVFSGPHVGSAAVPTRDGWRTQGGQHE